MADETLTTEIWRVIDDAPDYSVSNIGRVRRDVPDWQGKYAGRILSPTRARGGYLHHTLCVDGTKIVRKVHRLVCAAFNGPQPPDKAHCAHRDGDTANNTPANLYWATPAENVADRERHGRGPKGRQLSPEALAKLARGDQHWTRLHPEKVARGPRRPECICRGEACYQAKLTEEQVREILAAPQYFGLGADFARKFGVSNGLITAIRKGRAWSHLASDK